MGHIDGRGAGGSEAAGRGGDGPAEVLRRRRDVFDQPRGVKKTFHHEGTKTRRKSQKRKDVKRKGSSFVLRLYVFIRRLHFVSSCLRGQSSLAGRRTKSATTGRWGVRQLGPTSTALHSNSWV